MADKSPDIRAISYWNDFASICSGFKKPNKSPARRLMEDIPPEPWQNLARQYLADIPNPSPGLLKSKRFFNIGLQFAEKAELHCAFAAWCVLAGCSWDFSASVRLLSQMHSRPLKQLDLYGAALLLIERVLLKLAKTHGEKLLRPVLVITADLCNSLNMGQEGMAASKLIHKLLRNLDEPAASKPFGPNMFVELATALAEDGLNKEAESVAKIGLAFFPHIPELMAYKADRSPGDTFFERTPSELERMLDLFPDLPEFRRRRAFIYFDREDYARAAEDMRVFLDMVPGDKEVRTAYAQALAMSYRPIEAIEQFTLLIQNDPETASHYLGRARVYDQLDVSDRAMEDYARALELDPGLVEAQLGRDQSLLKRRSMGMDDDVYSAYSTGSEEKLLGEQRIPADTFADIAGLESVKEIVRETIQYPLTNPELAAKYGKRAGGGVLFFGPPGCGKTMLARAAAGECKLFFINVNLSTVLDKWVGNSEKAIATIFRAARKKAPCIMFIDELDALGMAREESHTGWEKKIISQLLTEMDGIESNNENLMVLGATNAPWNVDLALRRAGRFGKSVFVPPPNAEERKAVLELYVGKKPFVDREGIDFDELAAKTEYHSSDNLRQLVEDAATIPWKEAIKTGVARPLEMKDLLAALDSRQADLLEWDKLVRRYEEFARQTRVKTVIGFRNPGGRKQTV
ncbi:MAG: AAA family ATPase [bacterium]|jgi:AAA+ superfamily predicted ATPase